MNKKIPLYKPKIGKKEIDAVVDVLKSGVLTRGPEIEKFENDFAEYTKQKHAITVNSGTSGLHLAVRSLGWGPGDEVITTPFSFVSSSNALLFEGVKPVFVDIDPKSFNIDVHKIEEKITKKTKGIILVHILGLPVDTKKIAELKEKYNLQIIEDACEILGYHSNVAQLGELVVYSFHQNKQMTTGEGGMVTTNDPELAEKIRSMRELGRSTKKNWLDEVVLGWNYRLTDFQAALGRARLQVLDKVIEKGEQTARTYSKLLKGIRGIKTPHDLHPGKRSWFVYFILLDKPEDRIRLHKALAEANIESSLNYFPPIYQFAHHRRDQEKHKHTEYVSERLLALPLFYQITDDEIKRVVEVIRACLKSNV